MVTVRLRAVVPSEKPTALMAGEAEVVGEAVVGEREVAAQDGAVPSPVIRRPALRAGARVSGPALLLDRGATVWVPPGWAGAVDAQWSRGAIGLHPAGGCASKYQSRICSPFHTTTPGLPVISSSISRI